MAVLKVRDENGKMIEIPSIRGDRGKSAYEYAQEGGYAGTEEEFAKQLANGCGSSSALLTDTATGIVYKLTITNGKLALVEQEA
jgi:hypothetical protein